MYEFRLPDIGEGLSEAELLEWLVKVGDTVKEGEEVALISTDKVNVDLPSPKSGIIAELPWEVGDVIPVGDVFMRIADSNESTVEPGAGPEKPESRPESQAATPAREPASRAKAAPALRRYAKEKGVDLSLVSPSTPDGRLLRADIDAYLDQAPAVSKAVVETFKLSGGRLAAAKRLAESSRTLATTTQTFEINADAIVAETRRLSDAQAHDSQKITPLPVIAK